jgi:hypothetical protein
MVKFQKHYVTDGVTKARVFYSKGHVMVTRPDGSRELQECVTLYAKDYDRQLGKVFADIYQNDTDSQSDYFDQGHVRFFPDHPMYAAAKARCQVRSAS